MLKILIEDSDGKSKSAQIDPEIGDVTIGRQEGNFIRLKERNVSRHHACIYSQPDGLYIKPVAARYGLKVNSKKIDGPTPINLGDEIGIGDYLLYIQDENSPDLTQNNGPSEIVPIEPEMQARFVIISSNFAGREYHITKSRVQIGRNPDNDIQISHASVSGIHAEVYRTKRGDYEINDLGSSNGTKINGLPISGPTKLGSGDAVILGHVVMRYCSPGDFWSLNYGINDAPKINKRLIITMSIVVVLLIGVIVMLGIKFMEAKNADPQVVYRDTGDGGKGKMESEQMKLILAADEAMNAGKFKEAEDALEQAETIDNKSDLLIKKKDKLEKENKSKVAYDDVLKALNDSECIDADDAFTNIEEDTWAFSQSNKDNLKEQIDDCHELKIFQKGMEAVDKNDLDKADERRDELKKRNAGSKYLADLEKAIRAKRPPAKGGKGGGGGGAAGGGGGAAGGGGGGNDLDNLLAEWKNAKAAERKTLGPKILKLDPKNVEVRCVMATFSKMSDKCKAVEHYKVVLGQGRDCKPSAKAWMEQNEGSCK